MKAIRGATTIDADTPEDIRGALKEMLGEICTKNDLKEEEIVCILLSNTQDIRSFYPAKAAREAGFSSVPLYSSIEPLIDGALQKCIRVMVLAETDKPAVHVYLRNASNLRKDLKKFAIALDGPAGSGKSTIAKLLAKDFKILYLDTGAMYRACALKALSINEKSFTEESVQRFISDIDLKIEYKNGTQHTILDGIDVSEAIRRPEISMAASKISALKCVRIKMVDMQRRIANSMSCVLDGRDIGSFVLPDAEFKFYITASAEVRAKRRYDELLAKGYKVDLQELQQEIQARDVGDATREFAPLIKADDAVLVDTSAMSIKEVVEFIKTKMQEKV